jgi:preprotein translocase subunit SecA
MLGAVVALHERGQPVLVGVRSVESSQTLAALFSWRGLQFEFLNAILHAEEARIVARAGEIGRITIATNMAGRGTDIRLGHVVPGLGGFHVIIAEVNESGCIDRQLAGRCGCRGDRGSVSIFASTEDGLVRRFLSRPARYLAFLLAHTPVPGRSLAVRAMVRLARQRATF